VLSLAAIDGNDDVDIKVASTKLDIMG